MTDADKLSRLKTMLEETDDTGRTLTDEQLEMLLENADGDLQRAAYKGALLKARCTGVSLPDGMTVESSRQYWLTVAKSYRGSCTRLVERETQ
ncbi:MAG: hypothetical protein ACI4O8_02025 [Aristaeellaceae bacterium]